ncbi:hypothetical protein MCOR25_006966 [Pyricularia grisea]|nr:hypothetical protein MCOR25_006966 [Pyricularia grisea]
MTRSEPLTSLALGRSPYDDVVQGDGPHDPRLPAQAYDERGRPINPEARRLNRELIRAHNEVMHAIGVAEPEDGGAERLAAEFQRLKAKANADHIGSCMHYVGIHALNGGSLGIDGVKSRMLAYKRYNDVPLADLYYYERRQRSLFGLLFPGLPCAIADELINHIRFETFSHVKSSVLDAIIVYIRAHLHIFMPIQSLGLAPRNAWFPGLSFFLLFSEDSPVAKPPPLLSFQPMDVISWLGGVAISFAPLVAHQLTGRLQDILGLFVGYTFYRLLPKPSKEDEMRSAGYYSPRPEQTGAPEQTPLLSHLRENLHRPRRTSDGVPRPESVVLGGEGGAGQGQAPHAAIRRQGTFSSVPAAEDYDSDEDDEEGTERVFATLVHVDRDPDEIASDGPPGVWSAELRPNAPTEGSVRGGDGPNGDHRGVRYNTNMHTLFPARLASDVFQRAVVTCLLTPLQAVTIRLLARSYIGRRPGGADALSGVFGVSPFGELSWRSVGRLVILDMVAFLIQAEIWSVMALVSECLREEEPEN